MFSKVLAIAAVLAASSQAFAAECARTYTIKAGDYCDKISGSTNTSTFQLAAVNKGKINDKCTNLGVGDNLCLGNKGEDCTQTYKVKAGDTCTSILNGANFNATILYLNNPQIDAKCTNIYVDEVLCVAPTVQVPAIPAGGVVIPVSGPPATPPPPAAKNDPAPPPPSTAITVTAAATPALAPTPPAQAPAPPPPAPTSAAPGGDDDDCDDDDDQVDDNDDDLPFCDEIGL